MNTKHIEPILLSTSLSHMEYLIAAATEMNYLVTIILSNHIINIVIYFITGISCHEHAMFKMQNQKVRAAAVTPQSSATVQIRPKPGYRLSTEDVCHDPRRRAVHASSSDK